MGPAPGDDALRELCFSDGVFRERYEGWQVLGRGSWATVVRTRSRDVDEDVALKILVNLDPELLRRVREEVRAVQALATPYLVHTYSLFDRGTIAWFEMEVVEGPTLQQELDRLAATGGRLPFVRACEIALAVSRCVWHAHRHGVLHRDIKPANVLLPVSARPPAKLSDFGIARLADVSRATPPGTITGTQRFASPESLSGQFVGPAHDVYGLATTLYALFSGGRLPHDVPDGASLALLRAIRLTERPAPAELRPRGRAPPRAHDHGGPLVRPGRTPRRAQGRAGPGARAGAGRGRPGTRGRRGRGVREPLEDQVPAGIAVLRFDDAAEAATGWLKARRPHGRQADLGSGGAPPLVAVEPTTGHPPLALERALVDGQHGLAQGPLVGIDERRLEVPDDESIPQPARRGRGSQLTTGRPSGGALRS
jgi:hypothetical protein